jgi:hypothetical protein
MDMKRAKHKSMVPWAGLLMLNQKYQSSLGQNQKHEKFSKKRSGEEKVLTGCNAQRLSTPLQFLGSGVIFYFASQES